MKKAEIIEKLVLIGCDKEEVSKLKVGELREMLQEEESGEESLIILDKLQKEIDLGKHDTMIDPPIKYSKTTINTREPLRPSLSDPPIPSDAGWTQYVLSLFQDDEMDGEHPRLEGLRRVAELLLGGVVAERCELISSPTMENGERACAKASIVFSDGQVFEALADACPSNCMKDFAIYPVAMADTRAKGRAYRSALKLKRVVSAEEIGVNSENDVDANRNIQSGQQTTIRLLSDRLNISIQKLLADLEISCETKDGGAILTSLKYGEAMIVLSRLNDLRQSGHIPEKIRRQ